MKKIVVVSDNHGASLSVDLIKEQNEDADIFVHCGDSEGTEDDLEGFIAVSGNNDWTSNFPVAEKFDCEGVAFLVTHGDRYGYFDRDRQMVEDLKYSNCDVLLSGHTHVPQFKEVDGFTLINPGSSRLPRGGSNKSYMVLYVESGKIDYELIELV